MVDIIVVSRSEASIVSRPFFCSNRKLSSIGNVLLELMIPLSVFTVRSSVELEAVNSICGYVYLVCSLI